MNDVERYNFDRLGYLHVPGLLDAEQVSVLYAACKALEEDALGSKDISPKHISARWGMQYWRNQQYGYVAHGERADGKTLMVEDFWLYSSAFDMLVGHDRTMLYVRRCVQGDVTINNSELRIRYKGNNTGIHMGFPWGHSTLR